VKRTSFARIYRGTPRNLARLAKVLRSGGLVAVPTETVYGLAADAFDPVACGKIFSAKGRPATDPLIVHIHATGDLAKVAKPNAAALLLAKHFWPGPLTIVLPKRPCVPDIVTAGRPSVAVRMPAHPLFRRLLKITGPLAAPSANPFGYISPTTAAHVREGLGGKIGHILEGGSATIGLESTIVDLRDPRRPRLLRPGSITREQLSRVLGAALLSARAARGAQVAPGQLARHYSPRTPVVLHEKITLTDVHSDSKSAWVFIGRPRGESAENVFAFSPDGALPAAARGMFALLREIDGLKFRAIHVELARGTGLTEAINDRLRRAAAR